MLTDGAVNNTELVVDFIRDNRDFWKVHTFGIGSGVSTDLVKQSAVAGGGHYFFIKHAQDIEKKVMEALSKNFFDYLLIKELSLLNGNNEVVESIAKLDTISHGSNFKTFGILEPHQQRVDKVKITLYDPNTEVEHTKLV